MESKRYKKTLCLISLLMAALFLFSACGEGRRIEVDINMTDAPTEAPVEATDIYIELSTKAPTEAPAEASTAQPTEAPTAAPTAQPTEAPTAAPTAQTTPKPTPKPTKTPKPTNTPKPTANPKLPYYLYLEKGSFTLTIYGIGSDGQYSKVIARYRASHGGNRTPAGTYVLSSKERWHPFAGGDNGYAQYAYMYAPASSPNSWTGLYVHGPMYREKDPNTLWPRYYDGSHCIGGENTQGCIRMVVKAVRFIYNNCPKGTILKIVNGSPKNTHSADVPSRHGLLHDPTDPDAAPEP